MIQDVAVSIGVVISLGGPVIGYVVKTIYAKIDKEAETSDKMDEKQDQKIEELRLADIEIRKLMRETDRDLYKQQLEIAVEAAYEKGFREGKQKT